jgi:undecaprenyl-diphosphatase
MPIKISPTKTDISIARAVAHHTNRPIEKVAGVVTWGADEKVLCALAAGWWLYCRRETTERRRAGDHLLLTTLAVSALPHLLKSVFDQKRPDRVMVLGHANGVPLSGKADDAFPSGHALHIGALASAAAVLRPAQRNTVWVAGAVLALSRVVLLAHWASDVAAGLVIGAGVERLLRRVTSFGKRRE